MNKELVVYTSFSHVEVQKIAVSYPSKLFPDLFEYYIIVSSKLVYSNF